MLRKLEIVLKSGLRIRYEDTPDLTECKLYSNASDGVGAVLDIVEVNELHEATGLISHMMEGERFSSLEPNWTKRP